MEYTIDLHREFFIVFAKGRREAGRRSDDFSDAFIGRLVEGTCGFTFAPCRRTCLFACAAFELENDAVLTA